MEMQHSPTGELIRQWADDEKLEPTDVAERLGIGEERAALIFEGRPLSNPEVRALAPHLGVSARELFTLDADNRQHEDDLWARALPHRAGDALLDSVERLERVGVIPEQMANVLADHGATYVREHWTPAPDLSADQAEQVSLILTEIRANLTKLDADAKNALQRHLGSLFENTPESIEKVARRFGVSRQALLKQAAGEEPRLRKGLR